MKKRKKEIIIITILSILFILLSVLIATNKTINLDNNIHSYILSIRNNHLNNIFKIITNLGSASCLIILTISILIFIKDKKIGRNIIIHLSLALLLNQFTKIIFARPRPININLIKESGYSFPSGHSMISLVFYGYIIYQIHKSNINKNLKLIINTILIITILLIGISRIYLGVHYLTDIIGGFILASIYLLIIKNTKLEKK